jgi:Immunity protein Imm5
MKEALAMVLQRAAAHVRADPRGALPLGRRETVYAALGPREGPDADDAHRRRARLAIGTCEHVLPLWEQDLPEDRSPRDVLALAAGVLDGATTPEDARSRAGRLWGRTENLTQLAGEPARLSVGFACAKAVEVAIGDEWFDPVRLDPQRDDGGDLFEVDTAFTAALAAAGGPPWSEDSDAEARREFWLWWLDAVEEAAR